MKRFAAICVASLAMFWLAAEDAQAQHFHRGFAPGWGGSGVSISIGRGIHPGFVGSSFGPRYGWNQGFGVGFVNPPIYRAIPRQSFYRGGFPPVYRSGFYQSFGVYGGRAPGCRW